MDERTLRVLEYPAVRERLARHTLTPYGRERAEALLPSPDPAEVAGRLQDTGEARRLLDEAEIPLRGAREIRPALHRARLGGALDPRSLLDLRDTLRTARLLRGHLLARAGHAPRLADLAELLGVFTEVETAVSTAINDDAEVVDAASAGLAAIRREQRTAQSRLRERLDEIVRSPAYARMLQEPIVSTRGDRYVVPVRAEHKGQFPGLVHDVSASGQTVFMEPLAAVQLGNRLRELQALEADEVHRILLDLSGRAAARDDEIALTLDALGRLDLAAAKGRLAGEMSATAPRLVPEPRLRLQEARHPLLQPPVVPIDVSLGADFDTLVITGPNTGGKTVALKTIGLLALMAQAGLHPPAAEAEVGVFPQVFADIGDEQSIQQSLSTFSSHLTAIVGIVRRLEPGSLVLLDEIGAGTDPAEGAALARAIIEHLHARGVRTAVTTHYSELKALAYNTPGIENGSVEFDVATLRPTYRLLIGVPGRSNAFVIAARLGLPGPIAERARTLLGREEMAIDALLGQIEADRRAIAADRAAAERARQESEHLRARAAEEEQAARDERRRAYQRAAGEAREVIRRARAEIEALADQMRAARDDHAARRARETVRDLEREMDRGAGAEPPPAQGAPLRSVVPGQAVAVPRLGVEGTVLGPPDERDEVEIQAGVLKVRVPLADLRAGLQSVPRAAEARLPEAPPVPPSISLRGLTVEEALADLDRYLDDAALARLPRAVVIHGKGTGALRRAVHDYLRGHPHVRAFHLAPQGEGGAGATVVELDV